MDSQHLVGDLLDQRYRIDEIHQGYTGIVYLCIDTRTGKPIAIKTFEDRYLKSQGNRQRFLEEALAWIELGRHPNIVPAYGIILVDEKPHLLMEQVIADNPRGATLKDYIFSRVIPMQELLQIALHICNGMDYPGKKIPNFVHRNLKPENILIGADAIPKVSDIGLMLRKVPYRKLEKTDPSMTRKQMVLAMLAHRLEVAPAFASPEQCMGKPLDIRSDIYSFGCILYLITTKRFLFQRKSIEETILAHIESSPPRPLDLESSIPLFLNQLILKCLRKKPEDRYPDFQKLREDLETNYLKLYSEAPVSFIEELPQTTEDHIQRAKTYFLLRRFSETESELNQAARLSPNNFEIPWLQGKLQLHQKLYESAVEFFRQAQTLQPDLAVVEESLGKTYMEWNRPDEAVAHFQTALSHDPTLKTTYECLGRLYKQLHLISKAERVLQEGIQHCPDAFMLYELLAEIYQQGENHRLERQTLVQAAERNLVNLEILLRIVDLCNHLHDRKGAKKWLDEVVDSYPESYQGWYRLGEWYETNKEWVKAAEAWSKAAIVGGGDMDFYVHLAALCYRIMRYDAAWKYVIRAEDLGAEVEDLKRKIQIKRLKSMRRE